MHRLPTTAFLDRDGVINRKMPSGDYVKTWAEFEFLPGAMEALRRLKVAGISVVVVTNQRGVALGRMTIADVDAIHDRMQAELAAHGADSSLILVCPHEKGACECRKPGLGLFRQAKALMPEIDFETSAVVGDSASDIVAGNSLGCASYLVGDEPRRDRILAENPEIRIAGWATSLLDLVAGEFGLPAR
jgi:D-glycero-D-manno-heptose 1,7-bisphosphate phosphatase